METFAWILVMLGLVGAGLWLRTRKSRDPRVQFQTVAGCDVRFAVVNDLQTYLPSVKEKGVINRLWARTHLTEVDVCLVRSMESKIPVKKGWGDLITWREAGEKVDEWREDGEELGRPLKGLCAPYRGRTVVYVYAPPETTTDLFLRILIHEVVHAMRPDLEHGKIMSGVEAHWYALMTSDMS